MMLTIQVEILSKCTHHTLQQSQQSTLQWPLPSQHKFPDLSFSVKSKSNRYYLLTLAVSKWLLRLLIYTTINFTRLSVTHAVSVMGWPAGRWRWVWSKWAWLTRLAAATLSSRDAHLRCTQGLAGRGDGYQCGLDWGRSSIYWKL